jgi:hypothetical protein
MTQKMKTRSAGSKGPNAGLVDLFRPYALAPTPLHAAIQVAAREAGWAPPWAMAARKSKNQIAGRSSGMARAGRADIRRHFVKVAFDRLKPTYRMQPYSDHSVEALEQEYRHLLAESGEDAAALMSASPFKATRETLVKDLKKLGIRSKRLRQRSG